MLVPTPNSIRYALPSFSAFPERPLWNEAVKPPEQVRVLSDGCDYRALSRGVNEFVLQSETPHELPPLQLT
jgi:hypothetical protein